MTKAKAQTSQWFILSGKGESRGPFSTFEIHNEINKGKLRPENLIRHVDQAENAWQPLGEHVIFSYARNKSLMPSEETPALAPVHFLNLSGDEFKAILHDNLKLREASVDSFDEKRLYLNLPQEHKFAIGNKVYVHLYNYSEQAFVNLWGQVAELSGGKAVIQWLEMSPLMEKKYTDLLERQRLKEKQAA